jgi:hypothetical protein
MIDGGALASWRPSFCSASPLFWPIEENARALESRVDWPTAADLAATLGAASGMVFTRQTPRPRRARRARVDSNALYDAQIARGVVPTRERSWHDLLNALVWAAFPRAKRALHARQLAAIEARLTPTSRTLPSARTREQDALAMIDEGGVLLLCTPSLEAEVRGCAARMDDAAIAAHARAGRISALVFGHALYEGLVVGGPPAVAAAVVVTSERVAPDDRTPATVRCDRARVALADRGLARMLEAGLPRHPDDLGHVALAAVTE